MDDHIYHHSFFYYIHVGTLERKDKRIAAEDLAQKNIPDWKKGATWTPSVSLKVNISDIPPSTLVCRDQRSWWQTSDPGALRGQKRSLWNLSVEGLGTFSPAQKLQLKRQLTARPNLWLWDFCETNIEVELKVDKYMYSNDFNRVLFYTFPFFIIDIATVAWVVLETTQHAYNFKITSWVQTFLMVSSKLNVGRLSDR